MANLKLATATDRLVFMTDSADHVVGKTGLTLTITASKAGGAFASISPAVTDRGSGWYALALTTSHTDTLGDLALHVTATGADPTDKLFDVVAGSLDADVSSRLAPSVAGRTLDVSATGEAAADVTHVLGVAAMTSDGTAAAGGASTITLSAGSSSVDDTYNHRLLTIVAGTGVGQSQPILDYDGATQVATMTAAWVTVPDNTSEYEIGAAVGSSSGGGASAEDIAAIKAKTDRLAFVDGRVDVHVGDFADGLAPNAVDAVLAASQPNYAPAKAGDAMTLTAQGVDAIWDEAQSGHTNAGTYGKYLDAFVSGVSTGGFSAEHLAAAVWEAAPAGTPLADFAAAVRDVNLASPAPNSLGAAVATIKVDTGAVKLKTDSLPASPAAVGSNMGSVTSVLGAVGSVTAPVTVGTVNDKGGYSLGATGLDTIPMTLNAAPSNFREWFVWLTLRFRRIKRSKATGMISVYGSNGTTVVTTQTSTDTETEQTVGAVQ